MQAQPIGRGDEGAGYAVLHAMVITYHRADDPTYWGGLTHSAILLVMAGLVPAIHVLLSVLAH